MALFKEIHCKKCGKKTNVLTRWKLLDKNYVCGECTKSIPATIINSLETMSFEEFEDLISYIEYSQSELKSKFNETHSYQGVHLDADNKLFYTKASLLDEYMCFELKYLKVFNLYFMPNDVKDGLLGKKVEGKLIASYQMGWPSVLYNKVHNKNISATAKSKLLSSKISYENPKGMDEFLALFNTVWEEAMVDEYGNYENSAEQVAFSDELQQAMILFMIDDLEETSIDDLKAQRNRLIKSFHPDKDGQIDTKFSQKINSAYELLKEQLK